MPPFTVHFLLHVMEIARLSAISTRAMLTSAGSDYVEKPENDEDDNDSFEHSLSLSKLAQRSMELVSSPLVTNDIRAR